MSLKHGILGFLSQWPMTTGYDLKKEFDTQMSMFWFTHLSQIYPELTKLEDQGLVESEVETQEGKPDKKIYTITRAGLEELKSWLSQTPASPKIKDSFLMQVYFMDNIPYREAEYLLKAYQKEREIRLKALKDLLKWNLENIRNTKSSFTARMMMALSVYKKALEEEKQYIKWCRDTIDLIESFSCLWTGDGTEKIKLADADASSLQTVNALPFEKVENAIKDYLGDLWEEIEE